MQTIDHPTTGQVKMPAWPVRFDGAAPTVKPSPLLGQHVDDVLGSWLGMDVKELAALRQDGIVRAADGSQVGATREADDKRANPVSRLPKCG